MVDRNDPNSEAVEAWNTVLFDKWIRFRDAVTRGFGPAGDAVLERHPVSPGARVLDVGCGLGDTTFDLAKRVGPSGSAVGVDAAARFIELASAEAAAKGIANARFVVADVEREALGGPYDRVFARFGTMFFASPVAALRNMRRALVPGGTLTFVVWRKKDENEVYFAPEQAVLAVVPQPTKREDQVTCGPGPFSMASPDVVSAQLVAAGFLRPTFERLDLRIWTGRTIDDAIDFALNLGPAGEVMRLAGEVAEAKRPAVVATLRDLFAPWAREDGVYGPASVWIVSAVAP